MSHRLKPLPRTQIYNNIEGDIKMLTTTDIIIIYSDYYVQHMNNKILCTSTKPSQQPAQGCVKDIIWMPILREHLQKESLLVFKT